MALSLSPVIGVVGLVPAHKHTLFQYTLPPVPQHQSALAAAQEGSRTPSLIPNWSSCLRGLAPASVGSPHRWIHTRAGFGRVLPPNPCIPAGRAAGQHVLLSSHVPSCVRGVTTPYDLHRVPPPRWKHSGKHAQGSRGVGMRSENRRGRDAQGALGCAETPGGLGRRPLPGRSRRRGSSRAGPGPWHGAAAARWMPPSVRGGWICRQPERFILLHSCQAAGAVLQLRHPFGLLLVSLPAPQLALGHIRLRLGCSAAPQVRPWVAPGSPSAALRTFPSLSPAPCSCAPRCAAAAAAGPDPRSMGALITLGLRGSGG